jgi:diguanylate cyclase (GGDEF)-like protein/PAS domain S-box-containing protein
MRGVSRTSRSDGAADGGRRKNTPGGTRPRGSDEQRQIEQRFRFLTERSPDVLLEIRDGKIAYVSPNSTRHGGLPLETVRGRSIIHLVHPDDLSSLSRFAMPDYRGPVDATLRIKDASGEWAWRELKGERSEDEQGVFAIVTIRDISARRAAEHERDRFFFLARDILAIVKDGRFLRVNAAFGETLGWTEAQAMARPAEDFIHPEDRQRTLREYESIRTARSFRGFRNRFECKDGTYRWLEWSVSYDDLSATIYATARDVSDVIDAMTSLQESEERFRALSSSAPIGVFYTDASGSALFTNARWQEIAGLSAAAALGDGWASTLHPDDRAAVIEHWERAIAEDHRLDLEFRFLRPDGSVSWVQARASSITDREGIVKGWVGTVEDITVQRAAAQALRESEERYALLIDRSPIGIFTTDADGAVASVNEAALRIFGAPDEQAARAMNLLDSPSARASGLSELLDAVLEYKTPVNSELSYSSPWGKESEISVRIAPFVRPDGELLGTMTILEDITSRKHAERALVESERMLRTVVDSAPVIMFAIDRAGVFTLLEGKGLSALGVEGHEIVGQNMRQVFANVPNVLEAIERAMLGEPGSGEADLGRFSFEAHYMPLRDDDGVTGVMGVAVDMTERKRAERALAEKSLELEAALEAARLAARTDALTGALNHGAITEALEGLAAGPRARFALAMVDVDGMKSANDTYGHLAGDLVLQRVTQAITRDGAIVGRYGGDEFLVLLPAASRDGAEAYRAACNTDLDGAQVIDPDSGATVPVFASIGLGVYPDDAAGVAMLIERADEAMYEAKKARKQGASRLSNTRAMEDERTTRLIGELVPLLTGGASLDDRLRLISHHITMAGNYDGVNFSLFDEQALGGNPDGAPRVNMFARTSDDVLDAWQQSQQETSATPTPIAQLLEETQQPAIIDEIATDERLAQNTRNILKLAGIESGIAVPMLWEGAVLGIMSVGRKQTRGFDSREARFLMAVATQITALLRIAALAERAQADLAADEAAEAA